MSIAVDSEYFDLLPRVAGPTTSYCKRKRPKALPTHVALELQALAEPRQKLALSDYEVVDHGVGLGAGGNRTVQ
jgi:hypothetical protein